MTIEVIHYDAHRKLVAVLATNDMGIYLPAAKGVVYMTAAGLVDHMRDGIDLDMLLKLDRTRKPVYADAVITIEPNKGFNVDHAPEPELVAVLGVNATGIFFANQADDHGVTFMDELGRPATIYPDYTLDDVLENDPGRTAVYAGSTVTFTL